jgi:hypothetical protein
MVRRKRKVISQGETRRSHSATGVSDGADDAEQPAGKLIALVAAAFEESEDDTVDNIARMAALPKGGDSDPTRETILSYIKPPKPKPSRGKGAARRNRDTPVHHKFAHLVINYLDGRRADDPSFAVSAKITNSTSWQEARRICKQVLRAERERRFERPLGSDLRMQASIASLAGVYAVCRRESSDARYHQELLILRNSGSRENPRCHCTLVSEKVVTRGEWMLMGNMVYCALSGFLRDNTHEIGGLYLAHVAGHELLSGFLAGAGTDVRFPVAMPLVAVKVTNANESILELGDLGDEAILRAFRNVQADLRDIEGKLHEILSTEMMPVTFHASTCNSELRKAFEDGRLLIHPRFRDFCKSSIQ